MNSLITYTTYCLLYYKQSFLYFIKITVSINSIFCIFSTDDGYYVTEKLLLIFKLTCYVSYIYTMAKIPLIVFPPRIANSYYKLLKFTKSLQQAASSVGFIKKCLHHQVIPKFAHLKGQFIDEQDKIQAERNLMASHLMKACVLPVSLQKKN